MKRDLKRRIAELERRSQVDLDLLLTMPDGSQKRMFSSTRHFRRCLLALDAENGQSTEEWEASPLGVRRMGEMGLALLRKATKIEGPGAELFGLLQALALGPVDTPTTEGEGATHVRQIAGRQTTDHRRARRL